MSERDPDEQPSARLLRALIWGGVGLAPVAAISVLVGGGTGSIRFAVLLIAVCVVLLGASLLIRNDPVLLKMDVEDRVGAEVDSLRGELRDEIAAAARVTGHRVQVLEDDVARLRGPGPTPAGAARPAVASASVPPAPRPAVASASVAPAAVAPVPVSAQPRTPASGSASVSAPAAPRQRAAASVPATVYHGGGTTEPPRRSRRHAAPDTGTDLARFGAGGPGPDDWSSASAWLNSAPADDADWSLPESGGSPSSWADPEPSPPYGLSTGPIDPPAGDYTSGFTSSGSYDYGADAGYGYGRVYGNDDNRYGDGHRRW
ncbi:hypothetical protein AB0J80_00705 [Actinoplanes sp. NPDC049548]|uniref:hypothetical protein n=1 Tax=Actinoplanes sp. NPDC049548 TaxID=3155152 RepID=UPI0034261466